LKKFKFSLQGFLDINIALEKEQKNQLAIINGKISVLESEADLIMKNINNNRIAYINLLSVAPDISRIKNLNSYIKFLNNELLIVDNEIQIENKRRETAQEALIETMKKRKSLERLKEKQYRQYLNDVERSIEKNIEEFASYSYGLLNNYVV
jgi:flagellar FliJ protein